MLQVMSLTVFALLVARIAHAPPGSWRYILGAAALALLASQLLPAGHPWRVDLVAGAGTLGWLALVAAPVAGYALVIRGLRRRTGVDAPSRPRHPTGLVRIADDAALAADTRAALDEETRAATGRAPETVSLAWRGDDGSLLGHARLTVMAADAQLLMLWVAAPSRRQGIGGRLLAAAEDEARDRGAARLTAEVGSWQGPGFLTQRGFRQTARSDLGGGLERLALTKELP